MKKQIKKSWSRMSKIEKRKAIASDVIAQIRSKILNASSGDYCSLDPKIGNIRKRKSNGKKFQQLLATIEYSCSACAMGSMMAVDIMARNNHVGYWNSAHIIKRFKGLFSELQLRLIETAFEREVVEVDLIELKDNNRQTTKIAKEAIRLGKRYKNENNRLIAIMNNIIEDPKGLFMGVR